VNTRIGLSARPGEQSGFIGLREDAIRILAASPDGIDEPALAQALFGTGSGERWVALLPVVLGDDERLERVDGRWRLKRPPSRITQTGADTHIQPASDTERCSPDLTESLIQSDAILTLALATTGADPRRHRIARIAVVRQERGATTARLDVVVSSGQRLSRYLRDAARVATEELDEAPSFADVGTTLREMLDGQIVHVYGAKRTQAFLDAELRRAELPGLDAQFIEIDALVRSLLPGTRKPGLFAAADELGIQHNGRGSPFADAELAANVVGRLRDRLSTSPARPIMAESSATNTPSEMPFTQEWLERVPDGPGVYIVEDAAGQALYVGKAIGLRRRLSAYVGRQPSLHRRLEALGVRAAAVSTIATHSDLEATLLEARLIRERQPEFNVARQTRGPTTIIRAAPDARSPGVRLVGDVSSDGARYFGPFESVSAARQAMSVARAAYPDAFARRRGEVAVQRQAVLNVCRLLSGQKEPTLGAFRAGMREAAAAGDQVEIDRLRTALRAVQTLTIRPSDLAGLSAGWRLLVLERLNPGFGRLHLIQDRRLVASTDMDTSTLPTDPAQLRRYAHEMFGEAEDGEDDEGIVTPVSRPGFWSPVDSTVLLRWLTQARARLEIQRLLPDGDDDRLQT
jgi:DNA polymerase III epsilon subunit-like protein